MQLSTDSSLGTTEFVLTNVHIMGSAFVPYILVETNVLFFLIARLFTVIMHAFLDFRIPLKSTGLLHAC